MAHPIPPMLPGHLEEPIRVERRSCRLMNELLQTVTNQSNHTLSSSSDEATWWPQMFFFFLLSNGGLRSSKDLNQPSLSSSKTRQWTDAPPIGGQKALPTKCSEDTAFQKRSS